jgi:hypothetical protein
VQLSSSESNIDAYGERSVGEPKTVSRLRCKLCNRVIAELVTSPYKIWCRKCKVYTER